MADVDPPRLAPLGALAALLHFGFDTASRVLDPTTPPYLLIQYMDETYRTLFDLLGVTTISVVTSMVNGVIAAVFATALQLTPGRRWLKLASLYAAIWLVTGGLMALLRLEGVPPVVLAGGLLAGLPRAAVVAWVLDRRMARP
jgi:hypothetical protein